MPDNHGWLPPYPRSENEDRCAGAEDLLREQPPERRRTRRSRRILLWLRRRVELLEFVGCEARSFDSGEYAFAQDAPCGKLVIDDFPANIAVLGGRAEAFLAAREL